MRTPIRPPRYAEERIGKKEMRLTCEGCGESVILTASNNGDGVRWPGYIAFVREHNECPAPVPGK